MKAGAARRRSRVWSGGLSDSSERSCRSSPGLGAAGSVTPNERLRKIRWHNSKLVVLTLPNRVGSTGPRARELVRFSIFLPHRVEQLGGGEGVSPWRSSTVPEMAAGPNRPTPGK